MSLILITPPATEPVTVAEAKLHLRIDHADEDAWIAARITGAREACEHILQRALVTQIWERVLDAFPSREIELGMPPVQSIVSVKYIDTAGTEQTMSNTLYMLEPVRQPGFVLPAYGTSWPATLDTVNAVRVRFNCGFGAASAVPESIKAWILLHVAHWHCNRAAASDKRYETVPLFDGLLDRWRTWL